MLGCAPTQVQLTREAPTELVANEAIAFVFFGTFSSDENALFSCTSEAVREVSPTVKIIPPHEFRRIAFPDLASDDALTSADKYAFDNIMHGWPGGQEQREQLLQAGIRSVIAADAWTTMGSPEKWGGCAGNAMGAACLGGIWWDRHSQITAEILDLKEKRQVGTVQAESSGTPWIAVFLWLPIGAPAFTQTGLCGDLGDELAKFLAGESTSSL